MNIGVMGARGIPSTYSGFETFLTALLPDLVRRGHDVTMYCRRGEVPDETEYEGVRLRHLPAVRSKALSTLTHGAIAAAVGSTAGHDVFLVVNVSNAPYCAGLRLAGTPVVLNTDGQEWLRGKWGRAARWYFRSCARNAKRCTTHLVTDCPSMAEVYEREFAASASVIPYMWTGIDERGATGVLERLGLGVGGYFVTGGRLVPENNIERIARAHLASGVALPLLVLGAANYDSPVARELQRLAESPLIELGGHLDDRAEFAEVLGGSRAYIHGHSVGGMNPSLVEAMGCRAHVLAFDTPFNRDTLATTGNYFQDFDVELASEIRHLADAGSMPANDAARARALVEFQPARVVGAYEDILARAAGMRSDEASSSRLASKR